MRYANQIEEKAVYVDNIHGKTIQWKTRKKTCSIIVSVYSVTFCVYVLCVLYNDVQLLVQVNKVSVLFGSV